MSTAQAVMLRQLEEQAKELSELRSRVGPPTPKLENIKPHQQVSYQELALLREAQVAGKYNNFRGNRAVICMDAANRPVTYTFGDPNATWDQFNIGHKYIRKILAPANQVFR